MVFLNYSGSRLFYKFELFILKVPLAFVWAFGWCAACKLIFLCFLFEHLNVNDIDNLFCWL